MHILRDHGERIIKAFLPQIEGLPITIVGETLSRASWSRKGDVWERWPSIGKAHR
jgi:hypothetical protein